jgi:hypothetical protein
MGMALPGQLIKKDHKLTLFFVNARLTTPSGKGESLVL